MDLIVNQSIENITDHFVSLFTQNREQIESVSPAVMNSRRTKALEEFSRMGIPNSKVEAYRYSDMEARFNHPWTVDFAEPNGKLCAHEMFQCGVPNLEVYTIYVVNGSFVTAQPVPGGVTVCSMKQAGKEKPQLLQKFYGTLAPDDQDGMVAMNTLFAQDGFFIHIPKGVVVEKPIQIVNIATGSADRLVFARNLIVAEAGSNAKVLFCDHTLSPSRFAINTVTEIFADENSVFDYYSIQSQHNLTTQVNGVYVSQKRHSNILTNHLTLQCGTARNNIYVKMDDEHCESHLYGLYMADKNQFIDNFSLVDHAKPHCESNELFKGVLDDQAAGSFTGRIMVRPDAQKTNAFQSNKNLLLSNEARFNTKPQLEIYADDVKCSHGATVGQIDHEALFYLRARGINEKEARILLMYAFAYEVLDKIRVEPLREQIQTLVEKRFRGELSKCQACVMCDQTIGSTTQLL